MEAQVELARDANSQLAGGREFLGKVWSKMGHENGAQEMMVGGADAEGSTSFMGSSASRFMECQEVCGVEGVSNRRRTCPCMSGQRKARKGGEGACVLTAGKTHR